MDSVFGIALVDADRNDGAVFGDVRRRDERDVLARWRLGDPERLQRSSSILVSNAALFQACADTVPARMTPAAASTHASAAPLPAFNTFPAK